MSRFAYLAYLVVSSSSMLVIAGWRGILDRRLDRALLITVPTFVVFDAFGVARGSASPCSRSSPSWLTSC